MNQDINNQTQQQYTVPTETNINTEEELLKAYIGNNYEDIKKQGFNIPAFFFSHFYLLYRKKILWAILYVFAALILTFFADAAVTVLSVILGIFFNKFYIEDCKKQIEKIKNQFPGADHETLKNICSQKGGTSVGLSIGLGIIFEIILVILVIVIAIGALFTDPDFVDELSQLYIYEYDTTIKMEEKFIMEKIPELRNVSSSYNYEFSYESDNDLEDYCDLYFHKVTNYNSIEEILKDNAPEEYKNNPITKTINNINWVGYTKTSSLSEDYVYITEKDGDLYVLQYDILGREEIGPCHKYKNNILDFVYEAEKKEYNY